MTLRQLMGQVVHDDMDKPLLFQSEAGQTFKVRSVQVEDEQIVIVEENLRR